ncbi:MAG TPA: hypothetical protein VMU03_09310, partial [Gammaproteobacteria bacterium]|nr:hypothetical protein [Gammaproteobacteria bacterium]
MGDLIDTRRLAEIGNAILQWLFANVFVLENAVQLAVILAGFGVSVVVVRRLTVLDRPPAQPVLASLFTVVRPLALALVWLGLLALTLLAAGVARWPNHLIQIAASLLTAWVVIGLLSQAAPSATWARLITWAVWSVAALSILRLLEPTIAMLDAVALGTPKLRISLYSVIRSAIALA